eukprot:UN00464
MSPGASNEDKGVFQNPGLTRNFTKKARPLCVAMRWSRKSRPRGIHVKFDSCIKILMLVFHLTLLSVLDFLGQKSKFESAVKS